MDRPNRRVHGHFRGLSSIPGGVRAFLGYWALSFLVTSSVWTSPATRVIGIAGDAPTSVWIMRWELFAIVHHLNPLFTTLLNAPAGSNLMWSFQPLPGVIIAPVTAVWGPVVSYNVLVTLSLALSASAMFAAARRLAGSAIGGLCAGLFYGFSPFMAAQAAGHVALTLSPIPPLLLLIGYDVVVGHRSPLRNGITAGLLATAQFLIFPETLAAIAVDGLVVVVALAALNRRRITREQIGRILRTTAWMGAAALVSAVVPLAEMFAGPGRLTNPVKHIPDFFVADLANYAIPTDFMELHTGATSALSGQFTGNILESGAYLGIPLIALLVAIAMYVHRPAPRLCLLFAALTAVLSMGPHLHVAGTVTGILLPWQLAGWLPLIGSVLPSRLSLLTDMWVGMVIAYGASDAVRRAGAGATTFVPRFAVTAALCIAALLPVFPYPTEPITTPPFFTTDAVSRLPEGSTVLVLPYAVDGGTVDAEVWQAASGMRFAMPEGYVFTPTAGGTVVGPNPTELGSDLALIGKTGLVPPTDGVTRARLRAQVRSWGLAAVVLGPMNHRSQMLAFTRSLLGSGVDTGGVTIWAHP